MLLLGEPQQPGKNKPGAPPAKGGGKSGGGKGAPPKAAARKGPQEETSGIGAVLAAMPGWSKALVVVLAMLIVLWQTGVLKAVLPKGGKYGPDLDSRIVFVGNAFCDNDPNAIKQLATPDSRDAVGQWYDLVHLALQTDSTRVVSLFLWSHMEGVGLGGVTLAHHDASHHGQSEDQAAPGTRLRHAHPPSFKSWAAGPGGQVHVVI